MKESGAKINLILGSHAHVPFGADAVEFENVYSGLLRPFVSCLYKYPRIQAALHYSGVLLYWIERSHPELFMLIEDMVTRRQVEMLGGGFYEPMMPLIPLQDKIGQIELLTTYLRRQFGKRPVGCWIPDFAWEQGLVSPLAACGMNYTFLSERQFSLAGGVKTPCVCEDQGKLIAVFPVMQSLEAALADSNINALLSSLPPNESENVISIFPDRINTGRDESMEYAWNRFFEELSLCESFVETTSPGKLLKNLTHFQKLYFPDSTSDPEIVPPRRFIIEHPEAGAIYSKMIFTNVLINQLKGDKSRKLSAREEIWKAQGSALFSKTGRNGLHNHVLRSAAYCSLIGAERATREKGKFAPSLIPFDFNMNGVQEWLFQDSKINCYVQSTGGGVFELDYMPRSWNYLDSCGGRTAFADRLLPAGTGAENLTYGIVDGARNCQKERYEPADLDKVRRKLRLVLPQAASGRKSPPFGSVEIEKTYQIKKDSLCVNYLLRNCGEKALAFQFGPEIDLALPADNEAVVRFFACKTEEADTPLARLLFNGADGLKIHDIKNEAQIVLAANRLFSGRISPVYIPDRETELYQAFCVMPLFPVSLAPGGSWELEFTLKFLN